MSVTQVLAPSGKALRAKSSSHFLLEELELPGHAVQFRCQAARELLRSQGYKAGFSWVILTPGHGQLIVLFFVWFFLNLGFEVAWGLDSMLLWFCEGGRKEVLHFGCLEMTLLLRYTDSAT